MTAFPLDTRPLRITATLKPDDALFECQKWDILSPEHPLLEDDFDWDLLDRSIAYSISETNRSSANQIICGIRGRLNYNFSLGQNVVMDDGKDYFLKRGTHDIYVPELTNNPHTTARASIYGTVDTDLDRYVMKFLLCTPISQINEGKLYIPKEISRRIVKTVDKINRKLVAMLEHS